MLSTWRNSVNDLMRLSELWECGAPTGVAVPSCTSSVRSGRKLWMNKYLMQLMHPFIRSIAYIYGDQVELTPIIQHPVGMDSMEMVEPGLCVCCPLFRSSQLPKCEPAFRMSTKL